MVRSKPHKNTCSVFSDAGHKLPSLPVKLVKVTKREKSGQPEPAGRAHSQSEAISTTVTTKMR